MRKTTLVAATALAMTLGAGVCDRAAGQPWPARARLAWRVDRTADRWREGPAQPQHVATADVRHCAREHEVGAPDGQSLHQSVKDALAAELAKNEPDLAAVAAVSDNAQAQGQALRKSVRAQWLALYATFSPDQKAIVKQTIQGEMAKAESFHQKMKERFHGKRGTSG
jgi:hypothetical protein